MSPDHPARCLLTHLFARDEIEREPLTVAGHHAWRESLTAQSADDDEDFDDLIEVDPFNGDPPSKRKDSELARVLAVLDSLEKGNG